MCSLYSELRNTKAIADLFRVPGNRAAAIEPKDAIFPGDTAPLARLAADDDPELIPLSWDFVLLQPGKAPGRVIDTAIVPMDPACGKAPPAGAVGPYMKVTPPCRRP